MKKGVGIALVLLLAVAVVGAIVWGGRLGRGGDDGATQGEQLTTLTGVVGSEKEPFFRDQRVKDALAAHGLQVQVTPVGSRDIANLPDLARYDFAFPSSAPAADRIRRTGKAAGVYAPFFSPLAIATYRPIVDVLAKQGIATKSGEHWMFDMDKYYALAAKKTRWDQLPGNTAYKARKNVLVTTTDVRRSNSAAMYLSLTSYVANGGNVVSDTKQVQTVVPKLAPLFLDQGYVGGSSEGPFEDYLAAGMGKTPMVMIYESQFLGRQMSKDGSITGDMVLMYPTPDVLSKHTLVAFKDGGSRLGELLGTDPTLVRLAAQHGFRPNQRQVFTQAVTEAGITPPPDLVDVVEPPTFEVLEQLIVGIEKLYG
ncbi:hypothetical protein [Mobilicoccus massiliensis]|uniref:hypothetical protein n=1 Tax=Mobilicoccus massiliensis TaxID=1522310 RepID=UPI00059144DA|nr:hypothetical protein [Mobilicoccus massiliensis]